MKIKAKRSILDQLFGEQAQLCAVCLTVILFLVLHNTMELPWYAHLVDMGIIALVLYSEYVSDIFDAHFTHGNKIVDMLALTILYKVAQFIVGTWTYVFNITETHQYVCAAIMVFLVGILVYSAVYTLVSDIYSRYVTLNLNRSLPITTVDLENLGVKNRLDCLVAYRLIEHNYKTDSKSIKYIDLSTIDNEYYTQLINKFGYGEKESELLAELGKEIGLKENAISSFDAILKDGNKIMSGLDNSGMIALINQYALRRGIKFK